MATVCCPRLPYWSGDARTEGLHVPMVGSLGFVPAQRSGPVLILPSNQWFQQLASNMLEPDSH